MTDGCAISHDGLHAALAIATRLTRRLSAWHDFERLKTRFKVTGPPHEQLARNDLLQITATIESAISHCSTCEGERQIWDYPHWPLCDCPGCSPRIGCPGETKLCPDCAGL